MWYKYLEETNEWLSGNEVYLPSGTVLNDDHSIQEDGWVWMDSPPNGFEDSEIFSKFVKKK